MKIKHSKTPGMAFFLVLLVIVIDLVSVKNVSAQEVIMRSKLWIYLDEAGLLDFDDPYNAGRMSYPGFFNSEGAYNWCKQTPVLGYRMVRQDTIYTNFVNNWIYPAVFIKTQDLTVETNYNGLENALGARVPEEVVSGSVITNKDYLTSINMPKNVEVEFKTKSMAWSFPKYDDFVITEYTIINRETKPLSNFTFRFTVPLFLAGLSNFENDVEYVYDERRKIFIFYDDRNYSTSSPNNPQVFSYGPGPETGDVGDPGDIFAANSIDHQVYCPSALGIGYVDIPPNDLDIAEGKTEGTVQHLVTRWISSTPPADMPFVENVSDGRNVTTIPPDSLTKPIRYFSDEAVNPLKSYRKAKADGDENAGNVWERKPEYTVSLGPYSMEPGDSLTFKRIICAGALDWNVAALGGLKATRQLDMNYATEIEDGDGDRPEHAAIKAFRENWDAAMELIETKNQTGYYTPKAVPPPTVGFPPKIGLGDELQAEPSFIEVAGNWESGVRLRWVSVPKEYADPITGQNDFKGYIIYRSNISIVGPWTAIDTILADDAEIDDDGKVIHGVHADPGVPYRYGVTSFDSEGLESAMTAYTFTPIISSYAPNDNLSKKILVVPNPYKQVSGFADPGELKRITLLNIPSKCTIRIFNLARDLIQTIEHDDGTGNTSWGSSADILTDNQPLNSYILSRYRQEVAPGLYFYHITNHVPDHEGETAIGKFIIIK